MENRTYIAIDLKSFYASVECADRNVNPLTTNLVVADLTRTEKTICLAVSPSLKAKGVPGRPRLFEVIQKVKEVNRQRLADYRRKTHDYSAKLTSESFDAIALEKTRLWSFHTSWLHLGWLGTWRFPLRSTRSISSMSARKM